MSKARDLSKLAGGSFATAAQGALAASALQPTGDGSGLSGISGSATAIVALAAAPAVGAEGAVYYNTTLDIIFFSNGSAWKEIHPTPPTATGGTVTLTTIAYQQASFTLSLIHI